MRKKRIMLIGAGKSGKTTIAGWLDGVRRRKLANICYGPETIDTPGAYLECPWMHCHLIGSASDAYCVLMLVDQSRSCEIYPPGFAKSFRVPVIGVITHSDWIPEKREQCELQLKRAGVMPPYYCITDDKKSFRQLNKLLDLMGRDSR